MHHVFHILFDRRLIFPSPIPPPRRILDCGFGSASWAIEVADTYERCEVVGVDISSHMSPPDLPPNLYLEIDDLNER
jgi:ubiquinone/menaquinone biosynthesis C-methylase UbiE